MEAYVAGFDH
jgi:hypothetical protein